MFQYILQGTFSKDIMVGEFIGKPEFKLKKEDILRRVNDLETQVNTYITHVDGNFRNLNYRILKVVIMYFIFA